MERIIFHIDINSAFLSWTAVKRLEEGADTDIREIPAIIGGDQESRHGVVLAKSVPARRYGIKTGEPVAAALKKCPGLLVFPPEHDYYHEQSRRFIELLRRYTPDIEQVSVDECYLDFTPIAGNFLYPDGSRMRPEEAARILADRIYAELKFTVNVGISSNKLLAKMASDFEKPNRVHTLFPEEIPEKMWPLPVGDLFMVGSSSVQGLYNLGIRTIGELANTPVEILEAHFKSHGRGMWEFANGMDESKVHAEPEEMKGVGNSVTLPKDAVTTEEAEVVLQRLADKVAERLRRYGKKAGMVSVEIKYADFTKVSHQTMIEPPTDVGKKLYETGCRLFEKLWDRRPIRLLGLRTARLTEPDAPSQLSIFDWADSGEGPEARRRPDADRQRKLEVALDALRGKYGKDIVRRADKLEMLREETPERGFHGHGKE